MKNTQKIAILAHIDHGKIPIHGTLISGATHFDIPIIDTNEHLRKSKHFGKNEFSWNGTIEFHKEEKHMKEKPTPVYSLDLDKCPKSPDYIEILRKTDNQKFYLSHTQIGDRKIFVCLKLVSKFTGTGRIIAQGKRHYETELSLRTRFTSDYKVFTTSQADQIKQTVQDFQDLK